jgi:hypothetical protein
MVVSAPCQASNRGQGPLGIGGADVAPQLNMSTGVGRQKVLRTSTHPVRSRSQSLYVIGCCFVFTTGRSISPIQNPAYSPPSAHLLYPQSRKLRAAKLRLSFTLRVVSGRPTGTSGCQCPRKQPSKRCSPPAPITCRFSSSMGSLRPIGASPLSRRVTIER